MRAERRQVLGPHPFDPARVEVAPDGRACDHPGTVSSPSIPLAPSVAVRLPDRTRAMALALGLAALGLYLLVGGQDSGTDEFIPLAGALLHGQLAVDARSWVELVPVGSAWYVPFPPVPALFYVPVVAVMGVRPWNEELATGVMPAILGGVAVSMAYLLLRKRDVAEGPALWITAGFALSTLLWVAGIGGTHHMAQVSAVVFLLGALWFALDRRRPIVAGFLFSLAVGSRLPVGAALPLFIYLYRRETWRFLVGAMPVAALLALYNLARFGSVTDFGYARIPSTSSSTGLVTGEPWFTDGIESPTYITRGLTAMLWSWPRIDLSQAPFVRPSLQSDSLLIAAPFLFWSVLARGRLALVVGLSAGLVILVDLMHGSVGFAQFGYRFILDATPLLLVLLGIAMPRRAPILFRIAVIVGAVVTAYALWAVSIDFIA
jgi:hypothetical protein